MEQEELGQTWNTARLYPREGTDFCLSYVGKCQRSAASNRFLQSYRSQSWDVQSCCTETGPAGEAVWILKWVMSSEKGSAGAGRGVLRGVMPR